MRVAVIVNKRSAAGVDDVLAQREEASRLSTGEVLWNFRTVVFVARCGEDLRKEIERLAREQRVDHLLI